MKGWTEEQITSAFPLYLRDNATLWYDAVPEETQKNLNNIKKSFLDRFVQNSISNWKENDMFFNKKQTEGQSVEDFSEEVHRLAHNINKKENDIKDVIIRGLLPPIRQFVLTRTHKTLKEVIESARMAQSLGTINTTDTSTVEKKIASLEEKLELQLAHICTITSGLDVTTNRRDRSPSPHHAARHPAYSRRPSQPHTRHSTGHSSSPHWVTGSNSYSRQPQGKHHNYQQKTVHFHRTPSPEQPRSRHSSYRHSHSSQGQNRGSTCMRCGKYRHFDRSKCPALGKQCYLCGKFDHLAKVCLSAKHSSH